MVSEKPFSLKKSIIYLSGRRVDTFFEKDSLFFMGRDALTFILDTLGVNHDTKVMLPAYTCVENIIPFIKRGVKPYFYDVDNDLEADITSIEDSIAKEGVDLVLYINYFGRVQKQIKSLKLRYGNQLTLIEDCSHSLLNSKSGDTGDFVFASLRKILPLPDGGLLKINNGVVKQSQYGLRLVSDISAITILLKECALLKKIPVSRRSISSFPSLAWRAKGKASKYMPQSRISKEILTRLQPEEIVAKRRSNFLCWDRKLESDNIMKVLRDIDIPDCPYGYPILIRQRNELVSKLRNRGIYMKVDWLWHKMSSINHARSYELSMHSITLPVHQDIDEMTIDKIINEINRIIGKDWSYKKRLEL